MLFEPYVADVLINNPSSRVTRFCSAYTIMFLQRKSVNC